LNALSLTELRAKLASLSIFEELDPVELTLLAERVQWLSVAGGSTLFSEGDQASCMYVVLSGRVGAFKKNANGHLELLSQTEPGGTIGEMALLSNERRSATIMTLRDTELVCLSKEVFDDLANRWPKVMLFIANTVATRLRKEMESRAASSGPYNVPVASRAAHAIFSRTGDYWKVVYGEEECLIKECKGLHYICDLLRRPGTDIHVLELVATVDGLDSNAAQIDTPQPSDDEVLAELTSDNLSFSHLRDAGEILDARAKAAYRRRLTELREDLMEAKQSGDENRGIRAEEEIAALTRELSRAVGLGGHDRRVGSAAERARLNVTRSINLALERIARSSPKTGRHLKGLIKTGTFCCYQSDPDRPLTWQL
jgi:CRP-like cAMP-binding protein